MGPPHEAGTELGATGDEVRLSRLIVAGLCGVPRPVNGWPPLVME